MFGAIATGLLGAIAGGQGTRQSSSQTTSSQINLQDINLLNQGRSQTEAAADAANLSNFNNINQLVNAGPGQSAVTDYTNQANAYASQLQNALNNNGMADANQRAAAQNYAQQMFAPEQLGLQQSFQDQRVQANRLAARLGRAGNDPILANRLAQEQTRQQGMLNARQGAFASEFANQMPQQAMQIGNALTNLRGGLASQAFANRQALLTMGNQLTAAEREYRLRTAGQTSSGSSSQSGGGGLAGAITGGLAGFGSGAGAASGFDAMFGKLGSLFSSGSQAIDPNARGWTGSGNLMRPPSQL